MTNYRIGTREEWLAASAKLLEREKEFTRLGMSSPASVGSFLGCRSRSSTCSRPQTGPGRWRICSTAARSWCIPLHVRP